MDQPIKIGMKFNSITSPSFEYEVCFCDGKIVDLIVTSSDNNSWVVGGESLKQLKEGFATGKYKEIKPELNAPAIW